jgi:hypothetical protein
MASLKAVICSLRSADRPRFPAINSEDSESAENGVLYLSAGRQTFSDIPSKVGSCGPANPVFSSEPEVRLNFARARRAVLEGRGGKEEGDQVLYHQK